MVLFLILPPIIAAILSFLVRKKILFLEIVAVMVSVIELAAAIAITKVVIDSGSYSFSRYFSVDSLGAILLMLVTIIKLAVSFYSISYLRAEVSKQIIGFRRVRQYYILLHFFLLAMFLAIITTSPIVMWIAIEATTLSTAFLISFYNKPTAMEAAWKYLIINSVGLLLGFLGTLLFFTPLAKAGTSYGLIDWQILLAHTSDFNPFITKIAFIFIMVGYGTKVGFAPMHTWLPDAHSKAPVPISSLLSGVLLNVAFLGILRFKVITDHVVGPSFSQNLLMLFGLISIVMVAFIIFSQKNYKRLLAYSSIENMGIVALGFGFGGVGTFGAMLHMIYHSLAKSALFLSAGGIFLKFSSTKIINVRGAISVLPLISILFIAEFLAITGVPPFGVFLTKIYILSAGMVKHPVMTTLALFSFVLVFIGFFKLVIAMVFGEKPEQLVPDKMNCGLIFPAIGLMIILISLGFFLPSSLRVLINAVGLVY